MDLRFQVHMQYCSLQHLTLLPSPVTSTAGCCFCFGSISSFFPGVSSPLISSSILGTYWPVEFIFQCPIFCLFIMFMGFSRQEYCSCLPFPFPIDHILSELSLLTCPSWVALQGMAYSFVELDKTMVHVIRLVSFLYCDFQSVCPLVEKIRGLWKLPDGRHWLKGNLGLVLLGWAMISKSLIQFSVERWGSLPVI